MDQFCAILWFVFVSLETRDRTGDDVGSLPNSLINRGPLLVAVQISVGPLVKCVYVCVFTYVFVCECVVEDFHCQTLRDRDGRVSTYYL